MFCWFVFAVLFFISSTFSATMLRGLRRPFLRTHTRLRSSNVDIPSSCALQSVGLRKFLSDVNHKPHSNQTIGIVPTTPMSINLACHLIGATIGYEGMAVFPSVFQNYPWSPSKDIMNEIKKAVVQDIHRKQGNKVKSGTIIFLIANILYVDW